MQTTYHWRSKLLLYSLLALLTLRGVPGHCDIAADYTTKLTEANRSYAQGKYDQALHQWKLLLTDFPQASYTDLHNCAWPNAPSPTSNGIKRHRHWRHCANKVRRARIWRRVPCCCSRPTWH